MRIYCSTCKGSWKPPAEYNTKIVPDEDGSHKYVSALDAKGTFEKNQAMKEEMLAAGDV